MDKRLVMAAVALCVLMIMHVELASAAEGTYEEPVREGIFLVRPDGKYVDDTVLPPIYLSDEDLTFYTCVEYDDVNVRSSVLCRDDNSFMDLQPVRWGDENCYITSVDLSEFEDCTRMTLQSDYIIDDENIELQKDININKHTQSLSRIVTTQYSDGGWDNPLDTAHAILALSQFPDVFAQEIANAQEYLKLQRNEEEKCWPKEQCKVSTTANIVALLALSGLDDTYRNMYDGIAYLEDHIFRIEAGEKWEIEVHDHPNNLDDGVPTECVFDDNGKNTTIQITDNNVTTVELTPVSGHYINFVCTENVQIFFLNERLDDDVFLRYEGDNMTYTVPAGCLTVNNENVNCDCRATTYALFADIDDDIKKKIQDEMDTRVEDDTDGGPILGCFDTMTAALYAGHSDDKDVEDELKKFVRLYQWNEGFWYSDDYFYNDSWYEYDLEEITYQPHVVHDNITNTIIRTAYHILGLLDADMERTDENIADAMRWISVNENEYSFNISEDALTDEEVAEEYWQNVTEILNDTKRNAMIFYALNNYAKPMIKSNPRIVLMTNESIELRLINPTVFVYDELTYDFSPPLDKYLTVEEKDFLDAYGFRIVTITQKDGSSPDAFGTLRISDGGEEIARIPVIITSFPEMIVDNQKSITVFGTRSEFTLDVQKSPHTFDCTLEWVQPDIKSQKEFTVTESGPIKIDLSFTRAETIEKVYGGVFRCRTGSTVIENEFTLLANKFSSRPIEVYPDSIYINETGVDGSFIVHNLLDQTIDVFITQSREDPYFELDKTMLTLYPGEEENITITNAVTSGINYTTFNTYTIKTFSLEEEVSFVAEIIAVPPETRPLFLTIMYWVIFVSLLGGAGWYGYQNRQKIVEWYNKHFNKETERAKVAKEVLEYERKEQALAILNMMEILRLRKMGEGDIRKELRKSGFTDEEINGALRRQSQNEQEQRKQSKPASSSKNDGNK